MNDYLVNTITITARFVNSKTRLPLGGSSYRFKLYDQDPIADDTLGECKLNSRGEVKLSFHLDRAKSLDSPAETKPDLYFILFHNDEQIYESRVLKDMDLKKHGELSGEDGYVYDLGTYVI